MGWKCLITLHFHGEIQPVPRFEITELQSAKLCLVETNGPEAQRGKHEEGATQMEKQDYLESFVCETSLEGRKEGNWGKKEKGSAP